jgi:hypothetical protein
MKKTILAMTMLLWAGLYVMAQNEAPNKNSKVQYQFFTNNIPSDWDYPLVGFVNRVDGNHASVQIGIVNTTSANFSGVQAAFLNKVGAHVLGMQSGFINYVGGEFKGIQNGFLNSNTANLSGIQNGFINKVGGTIYGIQTGFINLTNTSAYGVQCGFINAADDIRGLQYGFINKVETLRGLQFGFINSVDTVEKGLPIGFISIVKKGGYKSIEVSYNNITPLNIAFKTGIRQLYTYPMLAYDWRLDADQLWFGYGIGSNIDLSKHLFINPEMEWLHQVSLDFNHYTNLRCNLGIQLAKHLEFVVGPSLVWHFKIDADDYHQYYDEWDPSIVSVNDVQLGWNAGVRVKF